MSLRWASRRRWWNRCTKPLAGCTGKGSPSCSPSSRSSLRWRSRTLRPCCKSERACCRGRQPHSLKIRRCRRPISAPGEALMRTRGSSRDNNGRNDMAAGSDTPFRGTISNTIAGSKPWWPEPTKPPAGAPNILVVLFDDVGFSDFGCYGSPIKTPVIDALAAGGLRYSGFHTTAMCSTARAALLTGRNHHSVGVGCLANFDSGYPGYRGKIAREAGTLAEMLRPHGYRNYMVGKWHVTPLTEAGATGPFDGWPLGRGFDRYYGFMDAETDQYAPELVLDNSSIDPPGTFESGYHLTADLVDQSSRFLAGHAAERPDAPWLLWLALGACHAPHQAPFGLVKSYDEVSQEGWDAEREGRLARQKAMGIVPSSTRLPSRNPGVQAWEKIGRASCRERVESS